MGLREGRPCVAHSNDLRWQVGSTLHVRKGHLGYSPVIGALACLSYLEVQGVELASAQLRAVWFGHVASVGPLQLRDYCQPSI